MPKKETLATCIVLLISVLPLMKCTLCSCNIYWIYIKPEELSILANTARFIVVHFYMAFWFSLIYNVGER